MTDLRNIVELYNGVIGRVLVDADPSIHDLAGEVRKRLAQMDRLTEMLQECALRVSGSARKPAKELIRAVNDAELFAEAFYYFGFRARCVIKKLPGCKRFECLGIRDVRNLLVEHPEKHVTSGSFHFGLPDIAKVKPSRQPREANKFEDPGLAANLAEFCANLDSLLRGLVPPN